MRSVAALVLAALVACKGGGDEVVEADADADTDTDTDADTDTDTDADTDADADPDALQCTTPYPTPDPGVDGPSCVTGQIQCGDVITGTNTGGSTIHGTNQGDTLWMCSGTANDGDFDGPERIYTINPPPEINAIGVRLESCEPSWLLWHRSTSPCPVEPLDTCSYAFEGTSVDQHDTLLVGSIGQVNFVIEGDANLGGNYKFTVECFE